MQRFVKNSGQSIKEMKMKQGIFYFLLFLSVQACTKDTNLYLKAQVMATRDMDCGYPLLSFADDSVRFQELFHDNIPNVGKGLPAHLNITGQKLLLIVRTLNPDEEFACTAFGPSFPHLKILAAKAR
jgi:hypothetical protein